MPTFYLCLVQRQVLARERRNKASKNAVDVPLHVHRSFGCELVAAAATAAATDTTRIVVAVVLFFRVLYSFSFENEVTIIIIMLLLTQ